jgi:branched-chain amino acid transport system permease protein
MNWSLFWDLTVSGVTLGSVYALVALGYSMVYGILKLLNFAHGDVYMIGAFMGWFALHWLGGPITPSAMAWSSSRHVRCSRWSRAAGSAS